MNMKKNNNLYTYLNSCPSLAHYLFWFSSGLNCKFEHNEKGEHCCRDQGNFLSNLQYGFILALKLRKDLTSVVLGWGRGSFLSVSRRKWLSKLSWVFTSSNFSSRWIMVCFFFLNVCWLIYICRKIYVSCCMHCLK